MCMQTYAIHYNYTIFILIVCKSFLQLVNEDAFPLRTEEGDTLRTAPFQAGDHKGYKLKVCCGLYYFYFAALTLSIVSGPSVLFEKKR